MYLMGMILIFVGNESQQLLEKITTLEEERFSILRDNETLREENMNLWTTVDELVMERWMARSIDRPMD